MERDSYITLIKRLLQIYDGNIDNLTIRPEYSSELIEYLYTSTPPNHTRTMIVDVGTTSTYYTLNERGVKNILSYLRGDMEEENLSGSDNAFIESMIDNIPDRISVITENNKLVFKNLKEGAFFPYLNTTKYDLSFLGIHKEYNKDNYFNTNCFLDSLHYLNIDEERSNKLKTMLIDRYVVKNDLHKYCKYLKIQIELHYDKDRRHTIKYGTEGPFFKLGLLSDHYFPLVETNLTVKDFNNIKTGTSLKKLDSYEVITYLLRHELKYLKPLKIDNFLDLGFIKPSQITVEDIPIDLDTRLSKVKDRKDKLTTTYFADTETFIENGKQKIYQWCSKSENGISKYRGDKCALAFLNEVYNSGLKDIIIYFHNAKFDTCVSGLIQYLDNIRPIQRGSTFISYKGIYKGVKVSIRDTFKFINSPLSKFPDLFNLDKVLKKDAMPYSLVTRQSLKGMSLISDAVKTFKDKDKIEDFLEKVKPYQVGEYFSLSDFSEFYCMRDVELLEAGFEEFSELMAKATGMEIEAFMTLSSLSYNYAKEQNCLQGVYENSGALQMWLSQAVVGGRVDTNGGKKYLLDILLQALDANSLYPSAMLRMEGIPKGKPKKIKKSNLNPSKKSLKIYSDYYVVKIKIKAIGIKRDFPLISNKTSGNREWINEPCETVVGKYGLEDLVTFQNIDYEIIEGLYWNEGFNTNIREVVKTLYNERMKHKATNKPLSNTYKDILNSLYGNSLLKAIDYDIKITEEERFKKHLSRCYNKIKQYTPCGNKVISKEYVQLSNHFNCSIFGIMVLEMSKRIMNEVMCLAEDNGIKIFYQDTDSTFLAVREIPRLEELYKEKYKRALIGNELGQFKIDLPQPAIRSIFLGKKAYINEYCENVKDEGKYHIRMKGITKSTLEYRCKLDNQTPWEHYEDLYKDKNKIYDMLEGGNKIRMGYTSCMDVVVKDMFAREVSFKNLKCIS